MTIDDILSAFKAGSVTQAQASERLQQLQDAAVADDRYDRYAMAALTGLLSREDRWPGKAEVVRECYGYAEAMQKAKNRLG